MTAPYACRSPTSRAAAASLAPHLERLEAAVLAVIAETGGATADECDARLNLGHATTSARISVLAKRGVIVATDLRRLTRRGRAAVVYAVAPAPAVERSMADAEQLPFGGLR